MAIYKKGLKVFPNSGVLYWEMGNTAYKVGNFEEALVYFEKGIAVDPTYSRNYYNASQLLLGSNSLSGVCCAVNFL